jgi:hypothetical protein
VQIVFIWITSLGIPYMLAHPRINLKWKHRLRLLINYFNRNFYQQILFFIIPIYYMSTTLDSPNVFFSCLLEFLPSCPLWTLSMIAIFP